jgi:hypothetical protein
MLEVGRDGQRRLKATTPEHCESPVLRVFSRTKARGRSRMQRSDRAPLVRLISACQRRQLPA